MLLATAHPTPILVDLGGLRRRIALAPEVGASDHTSHCQSVTRVTLENAKIAAHSSYAHECCGYAQQLAAAQKRDKNPDATGSTMQNPFETDDRFAIAERLRALLFPREPFGGVGDIAESLGVRESALRASIDAESPRPRIEVLLAVIRRYGVDPTWLLTGVYDQSTHREALEDEAAAERLLSRTTLPRDGGARGSVLDVPSDRKPPLRDKRLP